MSNTIDICQTGYDYEQFQLNELENENMKLKKQVKRLQEQLKEANELIKIATPLFSFGSEKADAELSNFKRYLIRWGVK